MWLTPHGPGASPPLRQACGGEETEWWAQPAPGPRLRSWWEETCGGPPHSVLVCSQPPEVLRGTVAPTAPLTASYLGLSSGCPWPDPGYPEPWFSGGEGVRGPKAEVGQQMEVSSPSHTGQPARAPGWGAGVRPRLLMGWPLGSAPRGAGLSQVPGPSLCREPTSWARAHPGSGPCTGLQWGRRAEITDFRCRANFQR